MLIFKTAITLRRFLENSVENDEAIGFVPTMGALHKGHISLVEASKSQRAITVVSIFVNPTQFNDPADFAKYPITLDTDIQKLEQAGCDVLFLPSVDEIYPNGLVPTRHFELGKLESLLEGFYRPGHFQGVCQVMYRLLSIVKPGHLYMGRKDYQQCMVIARLIKNEDWPIILHKVATIRETNGLAMSSRNGRLSEAERQIASKIYRQLDFIRENIHRQPIALLQENAAKKLLNAGFSKIDYVSITDAETLEPISEPVAGKKMVVLVAAYLNEVRLIDNMEIAG